MLRVCTQGAESGMQVLNSLFAFHSVQNPCLEDAVNRIRDGFLCSGTALMDILRGVFHGDLNSYQDGNQDSATHSSIVFQASHIYGQNT